MGMLVPVEQLETSGGLRRMRHDSLVQLISDYHALTQHLDQDYREDEESARALWGLAEMKWQLLSKELDRFRRLANLSSDYADRARARPDLELPRLRQFAAEIQTLIDGGYRQNFGFHPWPISELRAGQSV
jgi:hypothetical protein